MARITTRAWNNYIGALRRVSERASKEMLAMVTKLSNQYNEGIITLEEYENAAIDYAYALATKYNVKGDLVFPVIATVFFFFMTSWFMKHKINLK